MIHIKIIQIALFLIFITFSYETADSNSIQFNTFKNIIDPTHDLPPLTTSKTETIKLRTARKRQIVKNQFEVHKAKN